MRSFLHRLLLIENDGVAHDVLPILASGGWIVQPTTTVREAIFTAKQHPVDALVIALRLPDERGDVAFYRIAAQYPHLRTRALFLVDTDQEVELANQREYQYVKLPTALEAIVEMIERVCGDPSL